MMLEVIDRDGWRRIHSLEKSIVHIGSAPTNDVVLDPERGSGVSGRHAQLIRVGDSGYRLINLGETEILLTSAGDFSLAPLATADLGPGATLEIGEYTLVVGDMGASDSAFAGTGPSQTSANAGSSTAAFASGQVAYNAGERTSKVIGLRLALDRTDLSPDRPIEGAITVQNQCNRPGVQFDLEIENLNPDYYDLGPAPVLFPGAEKDIFLRIYHTQSAHPPAGEFRFIIRATAPQAYPGESAVVSETVNILPFYKHTLTLMIYAPPPRT